MWLLGTLGGAKSVPGFTVVPLNVVNVRDIEDMPVENFMDPKQVAVKTSHVASCSKATKKSIKHPTVKGSSKEAEARRNSITITDSGKTGTVNYSTILIYPMNYIFFYPIFSWALTN